MRCMRPSLRGVLLVVLLAHVLCLQLSVRAEISGLSVPKSTIGVQAIDPDTTGEVAASTLPNSVKLLREDNLHELVFRTKSAAVPWLVFFFSPSCRHCKRDLPHFINASLSLAKQAQEEGVTGKDVQFGIVDVKESPELREKFFIRSYPTIIYTTTQGKNWYVYQGGRTREAFAAFALELSSAARAGGFAIDVTDPRVFAEKNPPVTEVPTTYNNKEEGNAGTRKEQKTSSYRTPFYVFVPRTTPCAAQQKAHNCALGSNWSAALDGLPTHTPMSLQIIYEAKLPESWRNENNAQYVRVIEEAMSCIQRSEREPAMQHVLRGPDGVVLLAGDDGYRSVRCYHGPWLASPKLNTFTQRTLRKARASTRPRIWAQIRREMPPQPHPQMREFLYRHGYRAVEDVVNTALLSSLRRDGVHLVGILLTSHNVTQADTQYLPALREVVRNYNEAHVAAEEGRITRDTLKYMSPKAERKRLRQDFEEADKVSLVKPTVNWVVVNGLARPEWREQFDLEVNQLPAVFLVDTVRDRTYRLSAFDADFDSLKAQLPWGALVQQHIEHFVSQALAQKMRPEKSTKWGVVAEYFVKIPFVGRLFGALDYEPGTFVLFVACLAAAMASLVIVVGLEVRMEMKAEKERKAARLKPKTD